MTEQKIERERLEADVVIVGAGPAGLACALRLAELIAQNPTAGLSAENIYVIEKADELGMHSLSGAVLDPRGLHELVPDFETEGAPLDTPVTNDAAYFFTESRAIRFPITPPPLRNHGNYVVSLARLVQWLGPRGGEGGGEGGRQHLHRLGRRGAAHRRGARRRRPDRRQGRGQRRQAKGELPARLRAARESHRARRRPARLAHEATCPEVFDRRRLQPAGLRPRGKRSLGSARRADHARHGLAHDGLAARLEPVRRRPDLRDAGEPRFYRPCERAALRRPALRPAHRLPAPQAPPVRPLAARRRQDGPLRRQDHSRGRLVGDSENLRERRAPGRRQRRLPELAAPQGHPHGAQDRDARRGNDFRCPARRRHLGSQAQSVRRARRAKLGEERALGRALAHAALQQIAGGRGLHSRYANRAGHEHYKKLAELPAAPPAFKPDGQLTFDKVTDVYHSDTSHEEDQPTHLLVADTNVCASRCVTEYGNPCQYFCPAAVYEIVTEGDRKRLKLNPSNCVHCKACDIMDPYAIIPGGPPGGGGGPHYEGM